ncbi:unnamed protein product [Protopolystoma xenopodis]|uniref:Uncharacterized protein n=1 Tax=Protopolystoma xenopodis TaxID=117903 RepID=A0A448WIL4_9PLAT|nr:unnamed protein product [Protopolystoma xenopodis]
MGSILIGSCYTVIDLLMHDGVSTPRSLVIGRGREEVPSWSTGTLPAEDAGQLLHCRSWPEQISSQFGHQDNRRACSSNIHTHTHTHTHTQTNTI